MAKKRVLLDPEGERDERRVFIAETEPDVPSIILDEIRTALRRATPLTVRQARAIFFAQLYGRVAPKTVPHGKIDVEFTRAVTETLASLEAHVLRDDREPKALRSKIAELSDKLVTSPGIQALFTKLRRRKRAFSRKLLITIDMILEEALRGYECFLRIYLWRGSIRGDFIQIAGKSLHRRIMRRYPL